MKIRPYDLWLAMEYMRTLPYTALKSALIQIHQNAAYISKTAPKKLLRVLSISISDDSIILMEGYELDVLYWGATGLTCRDSNKVPQPIDEEYVVNYVAALKRVAKIEKLV